MGLILIPSEVTGKTNSIRESITNITENYQNVLQVVQNFADNNELDSDSWNTIKVKVLDYHQIISQGIIAVEDGILSDLASLEQSVGTENLYEDKLQEDIERLEAEKLGCQEEILRLQELRSNWFLSMFSSACTWIDQAIRTLRDKIENINKVLILLRSKLQFLRNVESSTQGLFESSEQLLLAIEAAINDAGVEITGQGKKSDINWKLTLNDANAQMSEKVEAFIAETLKSELQIDINHLKELYGEEIVERLEEIMVENGISRLEEGSAQKFIETAMSDILGWKVIKANGRYIYTDENGTKNVLTPSIVEWKLELDKYIIVSEEVAHWYTQNMDTYCKMTQEDIKKAGEPSIARGRGYYKCTISGNLEGVKVGDDCSCFVWAVLVQCGYFDKNTKYFSSGDYLPGDDAEKAMQSAGFTWHPMSELDGEDLRRGDILVKNGHVEIFYGYNKNGQELALSWGNIHDSFPMTKAENVENIDKEYAGLWRIEP